MKRRRPRKKNCGRYGHGARSIRRHAMTRTPPAMGNSPIPQHVAIIMAGNGRWAQARGKLRPAGHRAGVKAVRKIVSAARHLGIEVLTLFAFSQENWKRPPLEVRPMGRAHV